MLGDMFLWLVANLKQGVIYFIKQALLPNISAGSVQCINSLLLFAGFWHPARGICMNLQKQWKCFNGGSEVRCMTNDSVINDTSLKPIVDSENFVAIILDDLK